jgi:hypothetical protein
MKRRDGQDRQGGQSRQDGQRGQQQEGMTGMRVMSVYRSAVLGPVAAVLLPAYLSACFHYVPGRTDPLPGPRTEVQVHLTSPINVPLGEVTLNEVNRVEGIVAASEGDSLSLYAKWLYPQVGSKYDALGATFQFSRSNIARLDEYRFSGKLTLGAALIAGAVVVGFLEAIRLAVAGDNRTPGDPPPPASVQGWTFR